MTSSVRRHPYDVIIRTDLVLNTNSSLPSLFPVRLSPPPLPPHPASCRQRGSPTRCSQMARDRSTCPPSRGLRNRRLSPSRNWPTISWKLPIGPCLASLTSSRFPMSTPPLGFPAIDVKHRSTEVQKYRSTEVQKYTSTKVQKHKSTKVQKPKRAQVQKYKSTKV